MTSPVSEYESRAIQLLRDSGCKLTPQRRAIVRLFGRGHNHWTPQHVFDELEPCVPSLSLATVYNTLEVFEELGLVRRVTTRGGCTYFDSHLAEHHHAVCDACGELIDVVLDSSALEELVQRANPPILVESASIWFRGTCERCLQG